jgi:hypothetical protein
MDKVYGVRTWKCLPGLMIKKGHPAEAGWLNFETASRGLQETGNNKY